MPSSPRSEELFTAKSRTVELTTPSITLFTCPVFFSSTSMSLAPRNAMLTGVVSPVTTARTSSVGTSMVGVPDCAIVVAFSLEESARTSKIPK
jgi:hypothetical protein